MRIAHFFEGPGYTLLAVNSTGEFPYDDPSFLEILARHDISIVHHSLGREEHILDTVASSFFELQPPLDPLNIRPVARAILSVMTEAGRLDGVVLDCTDRFMPFGQPAEDFQAHVVASNIEAHHPSREFLFVA